MNRIKALLFLAVLILLFATLTHSNRVVQLQLRVNDYDPRDAIDKGSTIKIEIVNEHNTFCVIPTIVQTEDDYVAGSTVVIQGEDLGGCRGFNFAEPVTRVRAHYYNDRDIGWWTPNSFRVLTSDSRFVQCNDPVKTGGDEQQEPDLVLDGTYMNNDTYLEALCDPFYETIDI